MKRKKLAIISAILVVIVIGLITFLYSTFATDTGINYNSNIYTVTLKDPVDKTITLEPGESRTIIYKIHNDNDGTVQYGIGYNNDSEDTEVLVYNDTEDKALGTISKNEYKYVKLRLINHSSIEKSIILKTILGYEKGGNLTPPTGYSLVKLLYEPELLTEHIINLSQNNSTLEEPEYSQDKFYVSESNGLYSYEFVPDYLNFKGNGTNIYRYYGLDPYNYVYFNCDNYGLPDSSTCEIWRIISVTDNKAKIIKFMDKNNSFDFYYDKLSWDSNMNGSWKDSDLNYYLNNEYYSLFSDETKKFISSSGIWGIGENAHQGTPFDRVSEDFTKTVSNSRIGILQSSEYLMAANIFNCPIYDTAGDSYLDCAAFDWLFSGNNIEADNEWLINSDMVGDVFTINSNGGIDARQVGGAYSYRPVLYLNPGVVISSGNGDFGDPYSIDL